MSTIINIDLGLAPNDGLGDKLRVGGGFINQNFQELNTDKLERGGYLGTAQDLFDGLEAIDLELNNVPRLDAGNIYSQPQTMPKLTVTGQILIGSGVDLFDGGTDEWTDALGSTIKFVNGIFISRT